MDFSMVDTSSAEEVHIYTIPGPPSLSPIPLGNYPDARCHSLQGGSAVPQAAPIRFLGAFLIVGAVAAQEVRYTAQIGPIETQAK